MNCDSYSVGEWVEVESKTGSIKGKIIKVQMWECKVLLTLDVKTPFYFLVDLELYEKDSMIRKIEVSKIEEDLMEACGLLASCLEWDNGGERDYEKIVDFLNRVGT